MSTIHEDFPLIDAPIGRSVRVRRMHPDPDVRQRLMELGFRENAILRTVLKGYGNLICEVGNTRIGLNEDVAGHIRVSHFE
jgi:Fe2+ transport system protein FeoA